MELKRLFTTADAKGSRNYINSQKRYEIARTVIYFAISLSLFVAGYIQTGEKTNLLTIVAILGCLPASKSAVSAIMYLRFQSCEQQIADEIERHSGGVQCLYDMVFTSYKKNFLVSHLAVRGGCICGFSSDKKFDENGFGEHISQILKMDGHQGIGVKVFTNLSKYTERLEQMKALEEDEVRTNSVLSTLKSVAL